jgi:hypothetical protein
MGQLKKPSPLEYSKLTWKQKTWYLSCWYLDKCSTEELFVNGRPSRALGQVRGYFENRVPPSSLQCLYDAVSSLESKVIIDMFGLYQLSETVRVNQRMNSGKPEETVEAYESLLECMKGM